MNVSTISREAKKCLELFTALSSVLSAPPPNLQSGIDLENTKLAVDDSRARFRAWGTNIAAFHDSKLRTSLDSRLKEAPGILGRATQILKDLQEYLSDGNHTLLASNLCLFLMYSSDSDHFGAQTE